MSILVTGGAGFIGSHTCVELLNAGFQVVVVDNLYNASEKALERVKEITGKDLTFYKADIRDKEAMNAVFDKEEIEFIQDVAVIYGVPQNRVQEILQVNNVDDVVDSVKAIDNRRAALELIKEMCILANADENLSDDEVLFIGQVGEAMGVEVSKIQEISDWVLERLIWLEKGRLIFEEV